MESSNSRPVGQGTLDSWLTQTTTTNHKAHQHSHPEQASASTSTNREATKTSGAKSKDRNNQRAILAEVAKETRQVLPDILQHLPSVHASRSERLFLETLPALKAADCPRHSPQPIKIVNQDSFNAAIDLASSAAAAAGGGGGGGRVAVLNMASHANPGGGWIRGAMAQEEALCYRSSLSLSLHRRYYPWKQRMGIYTPDVVVIRSDLASGHKLLVPDVSPSDLPVVSVLSIAALRTPELRRVTQASTSSSSSSSSGPGQVVREVYAHPAARELTKAKMRLCLRMAAHRGHGLLVLGALGCGAFKNPPREVASCWLEVLHESEFQGGWWHEIWFAVFDRKNEGNFEVFEELLNGVVV